MTFERSGESYSKDDKNAIRNGIKNRVDLQTVSDQLKRSPGSIWWKAQDMKLHPGKVWYIGNKIGMVKSGDTIATKIVEDLGKKKSGKKASKGRLNIDNLSEDQCDKLIHIFENGGNPLFRELGKMGIPPVTVSGYYTQRKVMLKKLRARFDQIQNEKIKVEKVKEVKEVKKVEVVKITPVPPMIFHPAKNTPDVETLLVELLNETKVQTELLTTLARRSGSAS